MNTFLSDNAFGGLFTSLATSLLKGFPFRLSLLLFFYFVISLVISLS